MSDEPYHLHKVAGMDEADVVTAFIRLPKENRLAALVRLCEEIGPDDFVTALSLNGYQIH